jgi:hypothetical protein
MELSRTNTVYVSEDCPPDKKDIFFEADSGLYRMELKTPEGVRLSWHSDANGMTLHREDGPAVVHYDGERSWYLNGNRHRDNGPAIEWHSNSGPHTYNKWFKHGQSYEPTAHDIMVWKATNAKIT